MTGESIPLMTNNGRENHDRQPRRRRKDRLVTGVIIAFSVVAILLCVKVLLFSPSSNDTENERSQEGAKALFDSMGMYLLLVTVVRLLLLP
jgi:NADH:ubiquinone oxidoreductase subunit 6 (subunit J)